ncbi:helix-turn-helix domain-containing protein [Streptomyces goshikiensis]|uniref:helix-turn-helix domain-containing protein n=1 Tax=Streptomyces goshikiensis TaxID=1942 RepID=UPI0036768174
MVGAVRERVNSTDLGRALRELRKASRREAKAVARSAAMSPSKLSKIENGHLAPSVIDAERILSALGVPAEVKAQLTEAARVVATEATAWRIYRRTGLHKHQEEIRAIEAQTSLLRAFQPSCIPGLLQSPEYARAVQRNSELTEDALEKMIGARMRRQEVLYDRQRTFRFLITESVLRWALVRPPMMAAQLDKLVTMSRMPNIVIGVVPQSAPNSCRNRKPARTWPHPRSPLAVDSRRQRRRGAQWPAGRVGEGGWACCMTGTSHAFPCRSRTRTCPSWCTPTTVASCLYAGCGWAAVPGPDVAEVDRQCMTHTGLNSGHGRFLRGFEDVALVHRVVAP